MVIATPGLIVDDSEDDDIIKTASWAPKYLRSILNYSGLFKNISEIAYQDLMKKISARSKKGQEEGGSLITPTDLRHWKTIGVEALIIGKVISDDGGMTLELRTVDINRGKTILGKRYRNVKVSELTLVMRRYGNLILEAFTGKPGIFSSKIVFVGRKTKGTAKQIFYCDFDGSNVKQITNADAPHLSPHWSPDGKFITFTSYERKNPDLYLYEVATGKRRLISGYAGLNSGAQWAPNGKLVAYTGSVRGNSDIYMLNPFSGGRKRLISGHGLDVDPTFSPNGKYLAFVSGRFGNPHIFLGTLAWNGTQSVRVTSDRRLTYAGWYNSTPAWDPSSQKIVFAGYDKDINRYDIFIMQYDGKQLERLTLQTGDNESPTFSPNGQMIAFQSNRMGISNIKSRPQLFTMDRDGSNQRKLDVGLYEAHTPSWSGPLYTTSK